MMLFDRRRSAGADPERVAAWQARRFSALRRHASASLVLDDELPDDLLADPAATWAAIERIRAGQ